MVITIKMVKILRSLCSDKIKIVIKEAKDASMLDKETILLKPKTNKKVHKGMMKVNSTPKSLTKPKLIK